MLLLCYFVLRIIVIYKLMNYCIAFINKKRTMQRNYVNPATSILVNETNDTLF